MTGSNDFEIFSGKNLRTVRDKKRRTSPMGKSEKIRVGIIGSGAIARAAHLPGFKNCPDVELAAVCDLQMDRAKQLAQDNEIPNFYGSHLDMLKNEDLDVVSICTPNYAHTENTLDALKAGCHVLCEKPLACTAEEVRKMIKMAKRRKKHLMTAQHFRFTSEAKTLYEFVKAGDLGDVYFAKVNAIRRWGIPGWGVFHIKCKSGGGALIDIGVHQLDLTMWLMGCPEPVTVSGTTFTKVGQRKDLKLRYGWDWNRKEFDVDDYAAGFVRFKNGACLNIECSWAGHIKQDRFETALVGTEGGATTNPLSIHKIMHGTMVDITPVNVPACQPHHEEIKHFINVVKGEEELIVKPEETLRVIQVLEGLYRSSVAGKEVKVDF